MQGRRALTIEWEEDATRYRVQILPLDEEEYERYGGKFQVTVCRGKYGQSYPLNYGYKDPSYVCEKYHFLSYGDAENVGMVLNDWFGSEKGKEKLRELREEVIK